MKLSSLSLALLALAAGLVIAGCGDDDENPQTLTSESEGATGATGEQGPAPTKAAFVKDADAICTEAREELSNEAVSLYPEGPPTGEDAATFVEDFVIPSFQGQHDDLAALTPPQGDEEAVADVLSKLQQGIDDIAEDPAAFIEEPEASAGLEAATKAAERFGFKSCGL